MSEEPTVQEELVSLVAAGQPSCGGVFIWNEADDDCHLTLRYADKELTATETDYFEAMCTIRRSLEAEGYIPHCYGASRNAYPSGMSRNMGAGLHVYKLRQGEAARTADLVNLFANGLDVEPVTVAQQEAYYKNWLKSLSRRTV